jgi:hypothetical protein
MKEFPNQKPAEELNQSTAHAPLAIRFNKLD